MKTVSSAYQAILFGDGPILRADLLTITTTSGLILHWTSADIDLTVEGVLYDHRPNWARGGTTQQIGTSPDTIDLTLFDNGGTLIGGQSLMAAVAQGVFKMATVQVAKLVLSSWQDTSPGPCGWFTGYVSTSKSVSGAAQLTVKDMRGLLGVSMPRTIVQPQCNNTFGDSVCGFNKASVTVTGVCTGGTQLAPTASGLADGLYAQGKITFTSGANTGQTRTVKTNAGGVIQLAYPLPHTPASGDTFSLVQGCARTQAACTAYGNLGRFKGMPYVPDATMALEGVASPTGSATTTGTTGKAVSGSTASASKFPDTYVN